jgi:hemoglobin
MSSPEAAGSPDAPVAYCDEGGEAPCWMHLLDDERPDIADRADIRHLVVDFYRDVAMDDVLGPVFRAVGVDWSRHIPKLVDFWAWQLLGERGYEGNPLLAHAPVHARTPFGAEHYERWLELFTATVDARFSGATADAAKARARRMARAMQRLLSGRSASGREPVEVKVVRGAPHARQEHRHDLG